MPTIVTDYRALLSGSSWWGTTGIVGRPAIVTYSFETTALAAQLAGYKPQFIASFQQLTAGQREIVVAELTSYANGSGLTLLEVPAGFGDIRFGRYDMAFRPDDMPPAAGFASYPGFASSIAGDVFIEVNTPETLNFRSIVQHEVAHALGLKHGDEGDVVLPNNMFPTLMHGTAMYTGNIGSLDFDAVRYLYGQNSQDGQIGYAWAWDAVAFRLTYTGSDAADYMHAGAMVNTVNGMGGDDTIVGAYGVDTVDGGAGADTIWGLEGADTLSGGDGADNIRGGEGNDTLNGGAGADTLTGDAGNDTFFGGDGVDTLFAGEGNDTLDGGAGDDFLNPSAGDDVVDGGEGNDLVYYFGAARGVSVSLAQQGTLQDTGVGMQMLRNLESLQGGGFNDVLTGDGGNNTLRGDGGNDTLRGGGGGDALLGGAGADQCFGEAGVDLFEESAATFVAGDLIDGGADYDFLRTFSANVDYRVGTVVSIEQIIFARSGSEATLNAMFNASQIGAGLAANLVLEGSAAQDSVQIFATAGASVNISGWTFRFPQWGLDDYVVYVGEAGNESFTGFPGLDIFFGSAGNDTFNGGNAVDFAAYLFSPDAVTADLSLQGAAQLISATQGSDTFINLEGLAGSQLADTLRGNDIGNFLLGLHGNDTLIGRGGDDDIRGGEHADRIEGGAGADTLWGAMDAATMSGPDGADVFVYRNAGEGGDTIRDFVAGSDRIEVSAAGFGLVAGAAVQLVAGGAPAATGGGGQFLYNTSNGQLSWDADGTGGGAAVLLATLTGAPGLTAGDIVVSGIAAAGIDEDGLAPEVSLDPGVLGVDVMAI